MILVGDIGGTNTRLALAIQQGTSFRIEQQRNFETGSDLPALISHYLAAAGVRPEAVALCGAGPLRADGSISLTNVHCVLHPPELAAAAGLPRAVVVNDFEAVAHSLPALTATDVRRCGGTGDGEPHAPRLALGAGTGLGVAALIRQAAHWQALPGEGGHVDLAPVDDEELEIWQRLRRGGQRISAETVLSGAGLRRLHAALGGGDLDGPAITQAAACGDAVARAAQRLFTRWLGRVAGNAALTFAARGGVYIAGGIVPAWGEQFDAAEFRAGFEDKAPFTDWLAAIPSYVITHPQPALLGLARLASTPASD